MTCRGRAGIPEGGEGDDGEVDGDEVLRGGVPVEPGGEREREGGRERRGAGRKGVTGGEGGEKGGDRKEETLGIVFGLGEVAFRLRGVGGAGRGRYLGERGRLGSVRRRGQGEVEGGV